MISAESGTSLAFSPFCSIDVFTRSSLTDSKDAEFNVSLIFKLELLFALPLNEPPTELKYNFNLSFFNSLFDGQKGTSTLFLANNNFGIISFWTLLYLFNL